MARWHKWFPLFDLQTGYRRCNSFLLDCPFFNENVDSVWLNIKARIMETYPHDGTQICNFISNLDQDSKVLLLFGGLPLPFNNTTAFLIKSFMSSAVGKIYKLHTNKLRELEARWIKDKEKSIFNFIVISKFCNLGLLFSFSNFIFLTCKTRNM